MNALFFLIASAGVNTLLMPASAKGVLTYYSRTAGDEAIFYNPATFKAQSDYRSSIFYTNLYTGMKNLHIALTREFNKIDLGISIMNFDYGRIEARPEYPTEDSTGFYSANDFCMGVCVSSNVTTNGRFGVKAKYIYENISVYSGATLGLDVSLAYLNQYSGITVGANNIGGTMKIASESVNLPAKLSLGYYRIVNKFILSIDLHYMINTSSFESALAGEMRLTNNLELGVGINYRDYLYPGFYLSVIHKGLSIKYGTSFYPYNLGMINTVGISILF
ncbi:MAG: hypothetical protein ABIL20_02385 [candidate division WOR-3 bacterium]